MKQKIIFFDIEGGHGGSSRSLFYTLSNLPLDKFEITVVCKRNSWMKRKYLKMGIECKIFQEMPCFTALKGWHNNTMAFIYFIIITLPRFYSVRKKYIELIKKNDVVHLNQISLSFFGLWVRKLFPKKIITMHIRTISYDNFFSWLNNFLSNKICKKFIFITKRERDDMKQILKIKRINGKIITNPIPKWKISLKKTNNKINIASLSNYDSERGTDRIIEVASMIPRELRKYYIFHMIGDYRLNKILKNFFSQKNNLIDYSKQLGVREMFKFYGHKKFPEKILSKCQYLIKLTKENNPWGRDIIESIYLRLGIIATGDQSPFIKNHFNGYLFKNYQAKKIANCIGALSKNKKLITKHQYNSKILSDKLCDKKIISSQFESFWLSISKKSYKKKHSV